MKTSSINNKSLHILYEDGSFKILKDNSLYPCNLKIFLYDKKLNHYFNLDEIITIIEHERNYDSHLRIMRYEKFKDMASLIKKYIRDFILKSLIKT